MGPKAVLDGCGKSRLPQRDSIPRPKKGVLLSKVRVVTCHERTEGEKTYSSSISLTSGLDDGEWSTTGGFSPGKDPVPIV